MRALLRRLGLVTMRHHESERLASFEVGLIVGREQEREGFRPPMRHVDDVH